MPWGMPRKLQIVAGPAGSAAPTGCRGSIAMQSTRNNIPAWVSCFIRKPPRDGSIGTIGRNGNISLVFVAWRAGLEHDR